MMGQLMVSMFGSLIVDYNGKPITHFRSDKVRALLAYLVLEPNKPHQRWRLAALLWPEVGDKQARESLRTTLYQLRQALEDAAPNLSRQLLTVNRQAVRFNTDADVAVQSDVVAFRARLATCETHAHSQLADCASCLACLHEAMALYQDELLAGFGLSDAPAFEEWLLLQREIAHQQALVTGQKLVDSYEALGEYDQAYGYAQRLLALDSYREATQRQLLRLLAHRGLPDQALARYAKFRQLLRDELDAEPEAETVNLIEQIRRGEFSRPQAAAPHPSPTGQHQLPPPQSPRRDWHEMPIIGPFFGRADEAAQLETWLVTERCRVVALLAIGGMGKTSLAAQIVPTIAAHFDLVIWRSLLNAPPFAELLSTILPVLSNQQIGSIPQRPEQQLHLLFNTLQNQRVLLVLDNLESIMQADQAGHYRAGYEMYEQLLYGMATQQHQGQLLLTSREQPAALKRLEHDTSRVRSLHLHGLDEAAGNQLLVSRGLSAMPGEEFALTQRYSGNPLALKLVADTVQDLFLGDIQEFLATDSLIFDDVRQVLDQQFARLTALEQEILIWLAIGRTTMDAPALRGHLLQAPSGRALLEALNRLQRRSLIERQFDGFALQNVITEYLTDHVVEVAMQELAGGHFDLLHRHALLIAQAKDYIRRSQERLILQPLAHQLTIQFGRAKLRDHFAGLVQELHNKVERGPSYAGGNILNLLLQMKLDVAGFDLSALSVWQVDMQKSSLAGMNLTGADLTNCLFRQTFGRLETVAITPDGQTVAIGDEYGEIRLYRVADGQLQQQLTAHTNTVTALSFSADGRLLASCAHDQTARIWACPSGQLLHTLAIQTGSQYTVAFSADGRLLASGAGDATIYIWDIENGHPLLTLKGHTASVRSVIFVPNRHMLLSVGFDGLIFVWDLAVIDELLLNREQNGRQNERAAQPQIVRAAHKIGGDAKASFISLALSLDQSVVAAGTTRGEIYLWDFPAGALRQVLVGHRDIVRALAFWPDDNTLISASGDASIRVWNVPSGRALDMLTEHQGEVWALAVCPTNRTFVSCSDDATVRVWEMSQQRQSILTSTIHGNVEAIEKMAWSRTDTLSQTLIVTGNVLGQIRFWDVSQLQGECRAEFQELGPTSAMAFRSDGRLLAVGNDRQSATVRLWDATRAEVVGQLGGFDDCATSLCISPDGAMLACGAQSGQITLWDVENPSANELRYRLHGHTLEINSMAFAADGQRLVSASSDHTVRVWSVASGTELYMLPADKHNSSVACHPTASTFAYLAPDDHIHVAELTDVAPRQIYQRFPSLTNIVYAMVFSPDGCRLASVGMDHVVRIWDVASGRQIHRLTVHQNTYAMAYDPNGQMIATTGPDGAIHLWNLTAGKRVQILRAPRLYEGMKISGVSGISTAQRAALKALGAVED